jgi:hypothetical protein
MNNCTASYKNYKYLSYQIAQLGEDRLDKQHETVIWLFQGQWEEVGFLWGETRTYYSGPSLGKVRPVGHP